MAELGHSQLRSFYTETDGNLDSEPDGLASQAADNQSVVEPFMVTLFDPCAGVLLRA